jgi:hypothetical protein
VILTRFSRLAGFFPANPENPLILKILIQTKKISRILFSEKMNPENPKILKILIQTKD